MRRGGREYDCLARLQRLIYILNQNPGGISPEELARQCGVTVRQIYRDRRALEQQLMSLVIAHCNLAGAIRVFKVERIERIQLLDEHYSTPTDFDANEYLSPAWGITVHGEIETVKLRFAPELAMIAEETIWHPSQVMELQPDGSALVTMRLAINVQLQAFILGWGEEVEVLEPESLRKDIAHTTRQILKIYGAK